VKEWASAYTEHKQNGVKEWASACTEHKQKRVKVPEKIYS
jgi:hypothetical protein